MRDSALAIVAATEMPVHPSPTVSSVVFTVVSAVFVLALITYWFASGDFRRSPVLPLVLLGTAISAVLVEPVFDNTLLYWYPPDNDLGVYTAFGRTIPWFVPIGYAWFFGGNAYVLWRLFARGGTRFAVWVSFGVVVLIDAVAVSIAGWLKISGFYGPQPLMWGGVNVWFAFCDATAVIVGTTVLYLLAPRLRGLGWLWLLVTPTITYGAVLGAAGPLVTLAINSDWSSAARFLGGLGTIALCCVVVHGCSLVVARNGRPLVDTVDDPKARDDPRAHDLRDEGQRMPA
jgi:hypothetical protein